MNNENGVGEVKPYTLHLLDGYFVSGVALDSKNTLAVVPKSDYDKLKNESEKLEGMMAYWQNEALVSDSMVRERDHQMMNLQQDLASAKELIGKLKDVLMFYSNEENVALDAASDEYIEREMFAGSLEFFDKPLGTTAHNAVKQIESWEAGK